MKGRRLADAKIGSFPISYEDLEPGDYWRILHPKTGEPAKPSDGYWNATPEQIAGNLTGGVWGVVTPLGHWGNLVIHTVREHDDGSISVLPGDGSSNSILISGGDPEQTWHGYIHDGDWQPC